MKIHEVPVNALKPAEWRTTYVLRPDMDLLKVSMMDAGWLSPVLVRAANSAIIDGFHRWVIAQDPKFARKHGSLIPVVYSDVDDLEARLIHVRMNRARGQIVAKRLSSLLKDLMRSGRYVQEELPELLCMSADEIELRLDGTLLRRRNIKEHSYSKAWVPVEAPPAEEMVQIEIERPLPPDR